MNPTIILVRHGCTASNAKDDKSGWSDKIKGQKDLPLDAQGKRDAQEIAKKLQSVNCAKIYYSPLKRSAYTAQQIQKLNKGNPSLVPTKELLSWDLGDFVGKKYDAMKPTIRRYQTKAPDTKVPGGESWNEFLKPFLDWQAARLEEAKKARGAIVEVTHTWPLRVINAALKAQKGELKAGDYRVDMKMLDGPVPEAPGEAQVLEYKGGKWVFGKFYADGEAANPG